MRWKCDEIKDLNVTKINYKCDEKKEMKNDEKEKKYKREDINCNKKNVEKATQN